MILKADFIWFKVWEKFIQVENPKIPGIHHMILALKKGTSTEPNFWMALKTSTSTERNSDTFPTLVDSILLHAESGPNDHRKDAPLFRISNIWLVKSLSQYLEFLLRHDALTIVNKRIRTNTSLLKHKVINGVWIFNHDAFGDFIEPHKPHSG